MADTVSPQVRSRMMSGIRGRNTKPELLLRSGLHRLGLRFGLHSKLPGRPDIVLPRHRVAIFFHGCFWHGHNCQLFRLPGTRQEFWLEKIEGNRRRDATANAALLQAGWRVATVRECAIRGQEKRPWPEICEVIAVWIRSDRSASLNLPVMAD